MEITREELLRQLLTFPLGSSLCSFDVRGRPFEKALYWSDTNSFGPRAYFVTGQQPAKLSVDNIQLDDEGVSGSNWTITTRKLRRVIVYFLLVSSTGLPLPRRLSELAHA